MTCPHTQALTLAPHESEQEAQHEERLLLEKKQQCEATQLQERHDREQRESNAHDPVMQHVSSSSSAASSSSSSSASCASSQTLQETQYENEPQSRAHDQVTHATILPHIYVLIPVPT
jgi:hypothetical protein